MFFGRFVFLIVLYTCLSVCLSAQEDLSRNNELPNRIGGPSCPNAINREVATIAGMLNVNGTIAAGTNPRFSVAVYAGGAFISRQRIKNGGSFMFHCVPAENVTLVGEVDMAEVSNFSMGRVAPTPATNRQDVFITYSSAPSEQRSGIVSALYAYERSKENQKQFDRALDELQKKDAASAEKRLKKLVENDPKDFAAWTLLGEIDFNDNQFDDAAKAFEETLALKKDFTPAMLGMGRSLLGAKKFDEAIEVLKRANELEPNSADTNHYLGEAYLQIRKGSLGVPYLNKAIEIAPDAKADLHLRMAALYKNAGATQLAVNEYKLFLQKRPDYPDRKKMEAYIAENSK
ncbi:MAG TPA: tetratricopeptide repeat protein [Pyrinomonadaceae bacterium]|nr:tetratricopeptide repeat protein [Pyrinomonadaceae bacterium]